MLPKRHRFSFKGGVPHHTYSTPFFVIRYDTSSGSGLHIAVVVGKKVDKRAVFRNRFKRQIGEGVRALLADELNVNIVLFAKKQIALVDREQLYEELKKAFQAIHIHS